MSEVRRTAGVAGTFPYELRDGSGALVEPAETPRLTISSDAARTVVAVAEQLLTVLGPGRYQASYPAELPAGTYYLTVRTVVTAGQPALVDADDQLVLTALDGTVTGGGYLTLPEVKDHLRETSNAQDKRLPMFIAAGERIVVERCGPVLPVAVSEVHSGRDGQVTLHVLPVIEVTAVRSLPDGVLLSPATDTDLSGWWLEGGGVLELGRTARRVRVDYRAGRQVVPELLRAATLDLVAHLWRSSQNRHGPGQRTVFGGQNPDTDRPYPAGFAIPRAVTEMLAGELLLPALG